MTTRDRQYVEVQLDRIRLERSGRTVLHDIRWTIRPGERWILAGANGAGKTQLLKLIAGAVWPTPTGREKRHYHWRGELWRTPYQVQEEIAYLGAERQDKYERYGWNHTVRQIVGTGLYRSDIPLDPLTTADRATIERLLARLRISHLANRRFLSLSYGERRLVLLARALAARPKLLLLDELMNGLDPTHHQSAMQWLERSSRSKLPWVLSTHRVDDVPASATHALVLDRGRVRYRGDIRRARLERWLSGEVQEPVRARPARHGEMLVRLVRASVYIDSKPVLRDVSMDVRAGQCWVVHGHNGSGKTTLLRTLYGDHAVATGGRVERAGIEPGVSLDVFKRNTGLVAPHLQADHPLEMSVMEVVQSGRYASIGLNDPASAADRRAARAALEFFGLTDLADRTLRELSYGQMRRVLFARAWINQPKLLLLDEPLAGVDARTARVLLGHIGKMLARGAAVVMSTHRRKEWPSGTTHELELSGGRVRYAGVVRSGSELKRGGGAR